MFARQFTLSTLVASLAVLCGGCGEASDRQQVYADALNLYNAETESLQRLEDQRQRLVGEYQQQVAQVTREHRQDALAGQLGSAAADLLGGLGQLHEGEEPLSEDNVLDRLEGIEGLDAEAILRKAQDAEAGLAELPAEAQQQIDSAKQQLDANLAPLDEEIARQRDRVAKARSAKESAEAALDR